MYIIWRRNQYKTPYRSITIVAHSPLYILLSKHTYRSKKVKGMASWRKRNGDADDISSNRKRRNPNYLQVVDSPSLFKSESYYSDSNSSDDDHEINLITAAGRIIPVTVKGSDTIDEMKLKIQHAKAHIPIEQQQKLFFLKKVPEYTNNTQGSESIGFMDIFIKNLEGKITYCLEVKPSDTIGNLKTKMRGCVVMFNGVVLEDSGTLADLHIVNGSTLTSIDKAEGKMEIFVNNTFIKKTISLLVTPKDTIASVKCRISCEEKLICYSEKLKWNPISSGEQVLIFNGMALEDSGTLFDFHIKGKSTLTLMRRSRRLMEIFITFRERVITVEVNPSYTIGKVKSKIQDKLDIPHDKQELIFNEVVLDNFDTIADFEINEESTLTLVRKSAGHMHIFIETVSGKTINMKVKPSDNVYNVISKISDMEGVPRYHLKLLFNGRCLNDNLTLADYQIHEKSTIHSVLQLRG